MLILIFSDINIYKENEESEEPLQLLHRIDTLEITNFMVYKTMDNAYTMCMSQGAEFFQFNLNSLFESNEEENNQNDISDVHSLELNGKKKK